ncbi:MAG: glycosyltransferase family 39 protein [Proteobacteria bacterium]|nr:glycosyltransferase family 39 protein [Pseudomonadota bacterium]
MTITPGSDPKVVQKQFVLLLIFGAIFLIPGIGNVQLVDWDENIYAEASRQMMIRGDYLNVYVNNHLFAEKPPFYFWEQVLSYKLFGVNEFAARFPSPVAGLLMIVLLYIVGSKIGSPRFGLVWGLVYLTSFLPSVFGRVAVIDHTFNLFIATAAYLLYLFDHSYRHHLEALAKLGRRKSRPKRVYLIYLTIASISMGLGTLTKGPLAGVIPLVAFSGYKIFNRKPGIRIAHFLYCAVLSLSIALSWYLINWLNTGESFLEGFIKFQLLLFSKPMEGHEGPFFYHLIVAVFGLLPWTVLLFAFRPSQIKWQNNHIGFLFRFGLAWIVFVLVLFSLVSTKLPHYSASIYIPLSMLVAINIENAFITKKGLPKWSIWGTGMIGVFLALLFTGMPTMLGEYSKVQLVSMPDVTMGFVFLIGGLILVLFVAAVFYLLRKQLAVGLVLVAMAMLVFTQGLWRIHLPVFTEIHQQPLIDVVKEAQLKSDKVIFYRMVSFAAFFYGNGPIEVLHNYKFPGDPQILNQRTNQDIYIISDYKNAKRLQKDHPLVEKIKQVGRFCLYRIEKSSTIN